MQLGRFIFRLWVHHPRPGLKTPSVKTHLLLMLLAPLRPRSLFRPHSALSWICVVYEWFLSKSERGSGFSSCNHVRSCQSRQPIRAAGGTPSCTSAPVLVGSSWGARCRPLPPSPLRKTQTSRSRRTNAGERYLCKE